DPALELLRSAVAVLVSPGPRACLGRFRSLRRVMRERVAHDTEEPVLRAKRVQKGVAYRPLALGRRAVEVPVAHAGQHAGQVTVGEVVLAEDPLGLRPRRPTQCAQRGETHGEITEFVLR